MDMKSDALNHMPRSAVWNTSGRGRQIASGPRAACEASHLGRVRGLARRDALVLCFLATPIFNWLFLNNHSGLPSHLIFVLLLLMSSSCRRIAIDGKKALAETRAARQGFATIIYHFSRYQGLLA